MTQAAGARSRLEALCGAASLLLPLTLYLWTAAPAPTWLDSGEFLAVGVNFGVAHPPGHPLFITLLKLLSLLPLGSLAFRGALASAVPAALACTLVYRINLTLSRALDQNSPTWLAPIFSLLGALLFGASPALWGQATRPEVYSLQIALALGALLFLIRFGLGPRGERSGPLLIAGAFAFGLSLTNHHFLSLLLVPGAVVLMTEDALGRWRRTLRLLSGAALATATGLLVYAHLPLRTGRVPGAVSLGATPDAATFYWVISARAFQRAVTEPPTTSFGERLGDAAFLLLAQLGPITAVIALGGLYFLVRQRWGLGLLVVLSLLGSWFARSWMGFDPKNPDILGYLLVPVALLAIGAARVGPLLVSIAPGKLTVRVGAATILGLGLLATAVMTLLTSLSTGDLSNRRGAELVASAQIDRLPPRSVVVTELFGSGFNLWSSQILEGRRPDVAHFHFPFIGFPSYVQQVYAIHPDLQGVLRAALTRGELDEGELSALAQRRPVFVEPMLETPRNIQPFLLPRGLLWEASAEPLSLADLRLAAPDHFARWDELLARLGPEAREEQTLRVLLWRLFIDAMLLAQRGEREAALNAVERAQLLAPGAPELRRLSQALLEGEGRLDVTPFLPRGAQPDPDEDFSAPDEDTRTPVLDF